MHTAPFVSSDEIRQVFSTALSRMYKREVPQYGVLMELVADVNATALRDAPELRTRLALSQESARVDDERHGAIRLGTARELATVARMFAVLGMQPVGYYDLSAAGVPVHATAFRPVSDAALSHNPFRVFTSLLRLDLIADWALRDEAAQILARRQIFSPGALALLEIFEAQHGLTQPQASEFVEALIETFRWHERATVDASTYARLLAAHRLIADVVCFKGPHINHLTPRTFDIDAAQEEMLRRGLGAKAVIEGPPARRCPILLRQTSFTALQEKVTFDGGGLEAEVIGAHTARFGEIEQRGVALTRAGRALYDNCLAQARSGDPSIDHASRMREAFKAFPDDLDALRLRGLAFFRYTVAAPPVSDAEVSDLALDDLIASGIVHAEPLTYEDFLPVSAAGIFQSNLDGAKADAYAVSDARESFEQALGRAVLDETELYQDAEQRSIERVRRALGRRAP
ncbi:2-oxoadipate dioxygenase/decarboxylase HglS [Variovorax sp. SRS16]|uniref:2-oxoadipate dioxygenase/decarboxylase HglS n=1 Tax=Variovorax sp. SRS16 TaxID=282217 RepID=UPI003FCCA83C